MGMFSDDELDYVINGLSFTPRNDGVAWRLLDWLVHAASQDFWVSCSSSHSSGHPHSSEI
eukprot:1297447-Amphidinium_carterae.1